MADIVAPEVRSRMMAGIGPKDTKPEMLIRRSLHAMGWRYRLHDRKLPGRPDLVFPGRKAVMLINGCFWHGHDCHLFRWPSTRVDFWYEKIGGNVRRDIAQRDQLLSAGWRVCDVWECALKGKQRLPVADVLAACDGFLNGDQIFVSIGPDQRMTTSLSE